MDDGWMKGRVIDEWMEGWLDGRKDAWMMDGWMMNGWMGGWVVG